MQYEIGFFIPHDIDKIEDWKEKLEDEILRINEIIEKLNLPFLRIVWKLQELHS